MKRFMIVALVLAGICLGLMAFQHSIVISGVYEDTVMEAEGAKNATDTGTDPEQKRNRISSPGELNQSIGTANSVTIFREFFAQPLGTRCITPYTICDIEAQPINYPCCCPDGTCGYVSE